MIKGIRRRFIRIAVAVLSIVMISLTIVINMVNYIQVRSELEETLMNLSEQEVSALKGRKNKNRRQQNALDEARYFTAVVNKERKTDAIGENRMPGEAPEELRSLADTALSSGRTSGWIGPYLYVIREEKTNRMMAVFLNGETKMDGVRSLMVISGISCACGILLAWLGMAMISLKLWELQSLALPLIVILVSQVLMMALFAYFVAFPLLGRDYDAAVLCAGICGFGLGATPNAMANMSAVCYKYRYTVKPFLIVPIIGAMFADLINTGIITFFLNIL